MLHLGAYFRSHRLTLSALTVLLVAWLLVVVTNYTPGTWLIGWDNLLPEFDLSLNIQRSLSAAWQEFQGLGLVGGMGHAAELSRQLMLWVLSLVVAPQQLRYVWTFGMLLLGPIGVFVLTKYFLRDHARSTTPVVQLAAATVAGLFYLFNLATVQYFYVPLETFSSFYGFLPWLLWACLRYLESGGARRLLAVTIWSFVATSAFHVQTLLVVFSCVLGCFCIETIWRDRMQGLKRVLALGLTLFVINAFWLLPVGYFTLTSSANTTQAKQTLLSTPETQLMNESFGTLPDILLLRGYWFEYSDVSSQGKAVYLMERWQGYSGFILIKLIGYLLALFALAGVAWYALRGRSRVWAVSLVGITVLTCAMLSSGNGLLGLPYKILSGLIPLFAQMFRSAFTKWSMVLALVYSLGLGFFVVWLSEYHQRLRITLEQLVVSTSVGVVVLMLLVVAPIFRGQLIYDAMQLQVPNAYFQLFSFLKTQPNEARIVHLPVTTLWGWQFNSWGYRGSGFLWYGIEQPILDRNFDVWSPANETFYEQLSYAIALDDQELFQRVLAQYDVSYALIDRSIVIPDRSSESLYLDRLERFLSAAGAQEVWREDILTLYQFTDKPVQSYFSVPDRYVRAAGDTQKVNLNRIYDQAVAYITPQASPIDIVYPFAHLLKATATDISGDETSVSFAPSVTLSGQHSLVVPPMTADTQIAVPTILQYRGDTLYLQFQPFAHLQTGDTQIDLPTLAATSIEIPSTSGILAEINGTGIELTPSRTTQSTLTLKPREPITITYLDRDLIQKSPDGELFVPTTEFKIATVSADVWRPLENEQRYDIPSSRFILSLESPPAVYDLETAAPADVINCAPFKTGQAKKIVTAAGVTYRAEAGSSTCDTFSLLSLKEQQSYLIQLKGRGTTGRGLRFYLTNDTVRFPLLEYMMPTATYDRWFSVLNWPKSEEGLYYLNTELRGFRGKVSESTVTSLETRAVPLEWISSFKLVALDAQGPAANTTFIDLTHQTDNKRGTYFYNLATQVHSEIGLIAFSQSFDKGWIAFPRFQPWHHFEHVKYNGWANAWIIPEGEHTITILYWPQLLSFGGYALLFGGLGWLGWRAWREKPIRTHRSPTRFSSLQQSTKKTLRAHR